MSTQSEISTAFGEVATAFREKPELAFGSETSVTKVVDGLRCEVREGDWTLSVQSLEVEVQTDFDAGVLFGTSDAAAGYSEVRYAYLDVFARPQQLVRVLDITAPD